MKKLMTIFGVFSLASILLSSCGDVNVEGLDKNIKNKEDAAKAAVTLMEAQLELMEKAEGSIKEIADLKDRAEEIRDAGKDLWEAMQEEDISEEDLEDDKVYEEMVDKLEDKEKEMEDILEDFNEAKRIIF